MNDEFINRFNERDEIAFRLVFEALYPRFLKQAKRRVIDHHDAEDIVLSVFAGLWSGSAKFTEDAGIEAYIYYGVKNRCLNYLRSKVETLELTWDDFLKDDEEEQEPENRNRLIYLINKLPEIYRNVLLLELEGYITKEIAEIEGTTRAIIFRRRWMAIHKIKSLLNK